MSLNKFDWENKSYFKSENNTPKNGKNHLMEITLCLKFLRLQAKNTKKKQKSDNGNFPISKGLQTKHTKRSKNLSGNYHKIKSSNTWKQNTKKPLQKIKNLLISL